MNRAKGGGGYYSVLIGENAEGKKVPYTVFAASDWHAAKIVRDETGYLARESEVEGPY